VNGVNEPSTLEGMWTSGPKLQFRHDHRFSGLTDLIGSTLAISMAVDNPDVPLQFLSLATGYIAQVRASRAPIGLNTAQNRVLASATEIYLAPRSGERSTRASAAGKGLGAE